MTISTAKPEVTSIPTPDLPEIRLGRVRLLEHDEEPSAWNMAVDEAILDAVLLGLAPPTIRLYRWKDTSVSLGRHQVAARDVDTDFCLNHAIPIVKRPTGGRGILHGGDLCVTWVLPQTVLGSYGARVGESYRLLSAPYLHALIRLDIPARLGQCTKLEERTGDCFSLSSEADIVVDGAGKLVGSAQLRRQGFLLQQTSIRHKRSDVDPSEVFLNANRRVEYPLSLLESAELEEMLLDSVVATTHATLVGDTLTQWETERAAALMETCSAR